MNNLSQIQFMAASEVKKNFTNPDRAVGEYTQKQSYRSKLQESKDSGLYESIKKEGIKNPIVLQQRKNRLISKIFKPQIFDGTHRLVTMHDIDPNAQVPVVFKTK
jgi:hypothetical protein